MGKGKDEKIYPTHVIQELLKRAQAQQKSSKIRKDFTGTKALELEESQYSLDEIDQMVDIMAWVRNNLKVSAMVDENDAAMAKMGAREVQGELIRILMSATETGVSQASDDEKEAKSTEASP